MSFLGPFRSFLGPVLVLIKSFLDPFLDPLSFRFLSMILQNTDSLNIVPLYFWKSPAFFRKSNYHFLQSRGELEKEPKKGSLRYMIWAITVSFNQDKALLGLGFLYPSKAKTEDFLFSSIQVEIRFPYHLLIFALESTKKEWNQMSMTLKILMVILHF